MFLQRINDKGARAHAHTNIFNFHLSKIYRKTLEERKKILLAFIDLQKAFNKVQTGKYGRHLRREIRIRNWYK